MLNSLIQHSNENSFSKDFCFNRSAPNVGCSHEMMQCCELLFLEDGLMIKQSNFRDELWVFAEIKQ